MILLIFTNTTAFYKLTAAIHVKFLFPHRHFMFDPLYSFFTCFKGLTTMWGISHSNNCGITNTKCANTVYHAHIRHTIFKLNVSFDLPNHFFSHWRISCIFQCFHRAAFMMIAHCANKNANTTTFRKRLNSIKYSLLKYSVLNTVKIVQFHL